MFREHRRPLAAYAVVAVLAVTVMAFQVRAAEGDRVLQVTAAEIIAALAVGPMDPVAVDGPDVEIEQGTLLERVSTDVLVAVPAAADAETVMATGAGSGTETISTAPPSRDQSDVRSDEGKASGTKAGAKAAGAKSGAKAAGAKSGEKAAGANPGEKAPSDKAGGSDSGAKAHGGSGAAAFTGQASLSGQVAQPHPGKHRGHGASAGHRTHVVTGHVVQRHRSAVERTAHRSPGRTAHRSPGRSHRTHGNGHHPRAHHWRAPRH